MTIAGVLDASGADWLEDARAHLAKAFALNPALTVRDLPAAKALAAGLGMPR